jgi:hypothetical protein
MSAAPGLSQASSHRSPNGEGTPVTPVPSPPALSFAFTIDASIGPFTAQAAGPLGQRLHIPITGGEVSGPAMNGRIRAGSSDWALLRADGATLIDARYTIEAQDGTLVYVQSRGLRVSSDEVLARLQAGTPVADDEVYFRCAPTFEAAAGPHAWLNQRLFIASVRRTAAGVQLQVFQVG